MEIIFLEKVVINTFEINIIVLTNVGSKQVILS